MKWPRSQYIYLFVLAATCALLAIALYIEFVLGIHPCPLCVLQRLCFGVIAILALLAVFQNPRFIGKVIYAFFITTAGILGMVLSARQVYLQHQPLNPNTPCLPGLTYLVKTFSLGKALILALRGTIDCGRVDWIFLGLSMAEWAFLFFALFSILVIYAIYTHHTSRCEF